MDQPGSRHQSTPFVPSLQVGGFMNENGSEQGSASLGFDGGRQLGNFGLQVFCNNADDPWSQQIVNNPSSGQIHRFSQGLGPYYQNTYNFSDYRSGGLPSECGTLPPDSGYGSHRPQHSVASTSSIHEDEGPLDYQITDRFGQLGADNPALIHHVPSQPDLKFQCPDCNGRVRTKSELNKHMQRHRKPYHCPHPSCPRRGEGFSTKNDLARHKKSVHKELQGNGHVYICREGPCADKHKLWPRADNFRQHLTRVHQRELKAEDDLSAYVHQPSPLREDLKGVGSSVGNLDHHTHPQQLPEQPDLFSSLSQSQNRTPQLYRPPREVPELLGLDWPLSGPIDLSSQPSEIAHSLSSLEPSHSIQPSILADVDCTIPAKFVPEGRLGRPSLGNVRPQDLQDSSKAPQISDSPVDRDTPADMDLCQAIDLPDDGDVATSDEAKTPGSDAADEYPSKLGSESSEESPDPVPIPTSRQRDILKYLVSIPREMLESALKEKEAENTKQDTPDEKSNAKPQNRCAECLKTFNRPCELKKHIKRHEKPYGCTFRNCSKEFGSKNDWKRHESSQHYQLETWNCEEDGCKKVCHRREGFKNHLQKDHSLNNDKVLEEKLERCRMGRHCDTRFWCGFCVDVVEIKELGANSWMKRCDHIDNHLMGKDGLTKKRSSDWKYMEDQQVQASPEPPGQGPNESAESSPHSSKAVSRRRKASQDRNTQPSKRSRASVVTMWKCHHCVNCVNSVKLNSNCINCDHQWCSECDVESTTPEDEGNGQVTDDSTTTDPKESDDA